MCDEMTCPICGGTIILTDPDHGSCDTCSAIYRYGEIIDADPDEEGEWR